MEYLILFMMSLTGITLLISIILLVIWIDTEYADKWGTTAKEEWIFVKDYIKEFLINKLNGRQAK